MLSKEYQTIIMPTLEADDSLGIFATGNRDCCIVSPDKDFDKSLVNLWDMKNDPFTITKEEGRQWHFIQTLAGDQTDGYAGVPGYGVKTAAKLFEEKGYYWDTVVDAFESKGLSFEDALLNARLAKILQTEDYSYEFNRPIPGIPPPPITRTDDGAGVSR